MPYAPPLILAAVIIVVLTYIVIWAIDRRRAARARGLQEARPRCKHGHLLYALPRCPDCVREDRLFFEEKEKALNPPIFVPFVQSAGTRISYAPGEITYYPNTAATIPTWTATTTCGSFQIEAQVKNAVPLRLPKKGEWWTPIACPKRAYHPRSIPFQFSWNPTPSDIDRVKCGCLVPGAHI